MLEIRRKERLDSLFAIRDLHRENFESLKSDPMYQHVARNLPDQAGIFYYENSQANMEHTWWMIKKSAREKPASDENITLNLGVGLGSNSGLTSTQILLQSLAGYIDFSSLPDYQSVKKYFGASVGFVTNTDEADYFLKPKNIKAMALAILLGITNYLNYRL